MAKDRYRNIGGSIVAGANPGEEFAFPKGDYNIEALIEGGHIKLLSDKSKDKPAAAAAERKEQ